MIVELSPEGSRREVSAGELARDAARRGGPGPLPGVNGPVQETRVRFQQAHHEDPIRHKGELLGFTERFEAPQEGLLRLEPERLRITRVRSGQTLTWALEDIEAIQASSSAIQFSPTGGGVVLLRFLDESPRRWDDLLRAALQTRWDALGRGFIVEFQPRIRVR